MKCEDRSTGIEKKNAHTQKRNGHQALMHEHRPYKELRSVSKGSVDRKCWGLAREDPGEQ